MKNDVLVMAIKPKYARAIYEGRKNWEFRKAPPPLFRLVFLYESEPVSAITGSCVFIASISGSADSVMSMIECLPSRVENQVGISLDELKVYAGAKTVTALRVVEPLVLKYPVKLKCRPPQNWCRMATLADAE